MYLCYRGIKYRLEEAEEWTIQRNSQHRAPKKPDEDN